MDKPENHHHHHRHGVVTKKTVVSSSTYKHGRERETGADAVKEDSKSKHIHFQHQKSRVTKGRRNVEDTTTVMVPSTKELSQHHHHHLKSDVKTTRHHGNVHHTEPVVHPKPSYIPTETEMSKKDKLDRIERWRQEGAACLLRKQNADLTSQKMYSKHHQLRMNNEILPSVTPSQQTQSQPHYDKKYRQLVKKLGEKSELFVHSNKGNDTLTSKMETPTDEMDDKERITEFLTNSLHEESKNLSIGIWKKEINQELSRRESSSEVLKSLSRSRTGAKLNIPMNVNDSNESSHSKISNIPSPTRTVSSSIMESVEPKKFQLKWDYSTLKVMNLPLSITLNDLRSLFPQSTCVTIPMNRGESEILSGQVTTGVNPTAYVKFISKEDAEEVMTHFQGLKIRGHELKISIDYQHRLE